MIFITAPPLSRSRALQRYRSMPRKPPVVLLLLAVAAVCAAPLLLLSPRSLLVRKVRQLEAENGRLRDDYARGLSEGGVAPMGRISLAVDAPRASRGSREELPRERNSRYRCETIHVAIVAAGYETSRAAVTLVKSILFYRQSPLHFHFVSDEPGRVVLGAVFSTWRLPAVNVSFYSAAQARVHVAWVPNIHYSGVYGLLKLTLPDMLPSWVERVVVLDTDLLVAADIEELWRFFAALQRGGKWVGIVENQSDWYLGKLWVQHNPWPALGRGFNSGVMLLDLKAMRLEHWQDTWTQVARAVLVHHATTTLADQDIFNAVIKRLPEIHLALPCFWNVQFSDNTLNEYCFDNMEQFKIIHWNSPNKVHIGHRRAERFKLLYQAFEQYNGQLLRGELFPCSTFSVATHQRHEAGADPKHSEARPEKEPCSDFRREISMVYRTHPFFLDFSFSSGPTDVTLVTQFSLDRLHMLEPLCLLWDGPMSLAVYATDSEASHLLSYVHDSAVVSARKNLGMHIVFTEGKFYPVNYLRNVALNHAQTPNVFLNDIDFLPMQHLYSYVKEAVRVLGMAEGKRALVIPAFESLLYKTELPESKAELLHKLADGKLHPFRQNEWAAGHHATHQLSALENSHCALSHQVGSGLRTLRCRELKREPIRRAFCWVWLEQGVSHHHSGGAGIQLRGSARRIHRAPASRTITGYQ